jgi:hypothetical protein
MAEFKCYRLIEVEKERDALKAEIKKIIAIVENRNDLFDMVSDLIELFQGNAVVPLGAETATKNDISPCDSRTNCVVPLAPSSQQKEAAK